MKKTYKAVLFDADNTLFDFDAGEDRALRLTMADRGLTFDEESKNAYLAINRPLWDALHRGEARQDYITVERFRRFAAWCGIETDAAAWNKEYLERLGECNILLPGAVEVLEALAPHCLLALATNGLTVVQRKRLKDSPITPYFGERIFISQEMGVGKPEPEYFQRVLKALGVAASEAVMVGDNLLSDIGGAARAGLDTVWYSPSGEKCDNATWCITELRQLPPLILGHN